MPSPTRPLPSPTGFPAPAPLTDRAAQLYLASLAPRTRTNYEHAWRTFDAWRVSHRRTADPLNDDLLADYVQHMRTRGLSVGTARLHLSGIRFACRINGIDDPTGLATASSLKIFAEDTDASPGRGQAKGLRWDAADAAASFASSDGTKRGLRDAAILTVMSDAMLRASELVALKLTDVTFDDDGTAILTVVRSKTDRSSTSKPALYLRRRTVTALQAWLISAEITSGHVFRRMRRWDHITHEPLTTQSVSSILKHRAAAAGIKGRITSHSARVGGAQSLVQHQASLAEVLQVGRWRSDRMASHYSRHQRAKQSAVARLRDDD